MSASAGVDACPVSGRLIRLTAEGEVSRGEPRKSWSKTGASSTPRTRSAASSSAPKERSSPAAARGPASSAPTTASSAGRTKTSAGTRPAAKALNPPSAEGGSLRSQDLFTPLPRRPDRARRHPDPRSTPTPAPGCPATRCYAQPRRQRAPDRRLRLPQSLPLRDRPEQRRGLSSTTSATAPTRRSTASPTGSDRRLTTRAGPAYEGDRPQPRLREPQPQSLRGPLRTARGRLAAVLLLRARQPGPCPDDPCASWSRLGDHRLGLLRRRHLPGRLRRRPLLRRRGARLHLRDGCPAATGEGPNPATTRTFLADGGPYTGADIEIGPGRRPLLPQPLRRRSSAPDRLRPDASGRAS